MTTAVDTAQTESRSALVPMIIIGTLFFIFGFITWLNGALIPFLQIICDLTEMQALFIAFCFYIAYVVTALPMAKILERTGYHKGMVIGLLMVAAGLLLFVPAAKTEAFAVFLLAQFAVGTGLTILQAASNPYIVRIGPNESAAARIAVMGLLNKGAGAVAPIVFTILVLADFSGVSKASIDALSDAERAVQVTEMANNIIVPYVYMAIAMVVLAGVLYKMHLPPINEEAESAESAGKDSILQHPQLILGAIALFFYVGVEVIAADTIGLYGSALGLSNVTSLTSYTMMAMVIGYLLGLLVIPRYINQSQALSISALLGLLFTGVLLFSSESSTAISSILWGWAGIPLLPDPITLVALLGFANAMCWPAIWPLALADLGKLTARGSALLIMSIAGGAILPVVFGAIADVASYQSAYALLLAGYLVIGWYAVAGHKKRQW